MINSEKVRKLIDERISMLPDDPKVNDIWEELTDTFSKSEADTISYLKSSSREQIDWISEVFEDISENLQSENFIDVLEKLEKKFPDLDLTLDISFAKKALKK